MPDASTIAPFDDVDGWRGLMGRGQSGDARSYHRLFREVQPVLRRLARRSGISGSCLDDAVQEVLLALHTRRDEYDADRPLAPWLFTIARSKFIDILRREARLARLIHNLRLTTEILAPAEPPPSRTLQDRNLLQTAFQSLSDTEESAIRMVRLQGMSFGEAAAASGRSSISLRVAVHRGVKRLQRVMSECD
jgi:RNA polymerase sigma-70 factor (ECF subfamily)